MRNIKFTVTERILLESHNAQHIKKAVRLELCSDEWEDTNLGRFKNQSFGLASFSILLPFSEYDNYPIGSTLILGLT
jgi:hypothetical protein